VSERVWATAQRWAQIAAPTARSPFFMMPLWIGAGVILYAFGWSTLFSPLRFDTSAFLALAATLFLALALSARTPSTQTPAVPVDLWGLSLIGVYFIAAYIENGGVPLLMIATGANYDIYGFGIDGLHIAMLCFTGYYGLRAWNAYLAHSGRSNLIVFFVVLGLLASIGNRSAVSFLLFACAFIYVRQRRIGLPGWIALLASALIFAFLFGKFGDFRLAYQIGQATGETGSTDAVLQLARASDGFRESGISPSWLWAYTYFASPLANLNAAFASAASAPCGAQCDLGSVVLFGMTPDVIGARLGQVFDVAPADMSSVLVSSSLTATTAFGASVTAAGAVGGLLVLAALAVICVLTVIMLRRSPMREEGLAILATVVFFSFFENMLTYTGLIGQLAFPLLAAAVALVRHGRREPDLNPGLVQSSFKTTV
jgi:hypothetical protein